MLHDPKILGPYRRVAIVHFCNFPAEMQRKRGRKPTEKQEEERQLTYKCPFKDCRITYSTKFNLTEHKKRKHIRKLFVCNSCEEQFTAAIHNERLNRQQTKACEVRRRPMAPIIPTEDALLLKTIELYKEKRQSSKRIEI